MKNNFQKLNWNNKNIQCNDITKTFKTSYEKIPSKLSLRWSKDPKKINFQNEIEIYQCNNITRVAEGLYTNHKTDPQTYTWINKQSLLKKNTKQKLIRWDTKQQRKYETKYTFFLKRSMKYINLIWSTSMILIKTVQIKIKKYNKKNI